MTRFVLPVAVTGLTVAVPAMASPGLAASWRPTASAGRPTPAGQAAGAAAPAGTMAVVSRKLIAPLPGRGPGGPVQAGQASATCATYATRAGWPNNGYFGGDLVTAAAICVAESAGSPRLYVCDENGAVVGSGTYPPVSCPAGTTSYDRGLWQLNSKAAAGVNDRCAFDPLCNAEHAYLFSGRGTSFAPWASYDQDTYARPFLDAVQAAVTRLTAGTVTSALLGECLAQARPVRGAEVVIANCGTGAVTQRWTIGGGKLRAGSVCATIASRSGDPKIVLSRCGRSRSQIWRQYGRSELRNAADGKCLTDPRSSLTAGTQVIVTRCVNAKAQTWWLP